MFWALVFVGCTAESLIFVLETEPHDMGFPDLPAEACF